MKRLLPALSIATAALMLLIDASPAFASEAAAAPASEATAAEATATEAPAAEQYRRRPTHVRRRGVRHYRSGRRYYRAPVYRSHRHHSPVHVYHPPIIRPRVVVRPAPVVVHAEPVYVQEPVVVQEQVAVTQPAPVVYENVEPAVIVEEEPTAAIVFRFATLNESDTDLEFETVSGANLMGVGGALRFDLDPHWGIEIGLDILAGEAEGADQISVPITLSAMAHLFPDSVIDPYAVAGLGIMLSEFDDPHYVDVEQYSQFMGHVGGGLEINAGPIVITSDLRLALMQTRPDRDVPLIYQEGSGGGGVSIRGDEVGGVTTSTVSNNDADAMSTGLQFNIGAGWRF